MIELKLFGDTLTQLGFQFFSGVPCSFLKYLINYAIDHCNYIMAANEGDAVATCAGAYLGGSKAVFLCQNSGLSNAISPLVSLNYPFQIPVLGFVTLRGDPQLHDEPQHALMGKITGDLLTSMSITWEYLSNDTSEALKQLKKANEIIEKEQSFFFIVRKNSFDEYHLQSKTIEKIKCIKHCEQTRTNQLPKRFDVLSLLHELKTDDTILISTTGYTGRELHTIADDPHHLYMVGSMGCVNALALGLALVRPEKKVLAIDGDGALLMRLGSMATNAYYHPKNLFHLLLDNGLLESTGGQKTVADNINFSAIAAAMQYPKALYAHDLNELKEFYNEWQNNPLLTFVHLKTSPGVIENLGRPTLTPHQVKQRLMNYLQQP